MTRYADVKLDDQLVERRLERWRRISLEALKQCGRRRLVDITAPRTLSQFLDSLAHDDAARVTLLLFSEQGGTAISRAIEQVPESNSIVAFVGPEGGWADDEIKLLVSRGAKSVSLGPRILRTETAAVVAITLSQHLAGDLSVTGAE
jgi:16S rRNA (uracil1498-N3)-methyltransferase